MMRMEDGCGHGCGMFRFGRWMDDEFRSRFVEIIGRSGKKNNTYKFAWARFLIDHSSERHKVPAMFDRGGSRGGRDEAAPAQVKYDEIARYFFVYYWPLVCKTRLRQGPDSQPPLVTAAIRDEFRKDAYPQTVEEVIRDERAKVDRCVDEIAKCAFDNVPYRFQSIGGSEVRMFYQLAAGPPDASGNRKIDPNGGILINPDAALFFRRNAGALRLAVLAEWARKIESLNLGSPNLVARLSGKYGGRPGHSTSPVAEKGNALRCFYCGYDLGKGPRVPDHVIPLDYMGGAVEWNMVFACRECKRAKLGLLPPRRYVALLAQKNAGTGAAVVNVQCEEIACHYDNALRHGYGVAGRLSANSARP